MSTINVIIPTRGLIHSRTIESVLLNLVDFDYQLFISHDLPIPDSFNHLTELSLTKHSDYTWFVEEDMLIPEDTLEKMVLADEKAITVDYVDKKTREHFLHKNTHGEITFSGLGCFLVESAVLKELPRPLFKQSLFEFTEDMDVVEIPTKPDRKTYGTQDVYFCQKLRQAGIKIAELENASVGHLRIDEMGNPATNNGIHNITAIFG